MDKKKEEEGFEELLFEGVLLFIFRQIYALPLSEHTFDPILVNTRWNRFFRHPIQTFLSCQFDPYLAQFPPSYYILSRLPRWWMKLCATSAMIDQIIAVEPENDTDRELFAQQEMQLHYISRGSSQIMNTRLRHLADSRLHSLLFRKMPKQEVVSLVRWLRVWRHKADLQDLCSKYSVEERMEFYRLCFEARCLSLTWILKYMEMYDRDIMTHVIELAVRVNGNNLFDVPISLRTNELYELAVKQCGAILEAVPKRLRDEELCRIAVCQDGTALQFVPQSLITSLELQTIAVQQNGAALQYIDHKTLELCILAVRSNGNALFYVPMDLRTKEVCEIAVVQDSRALCWVPERIKSEELCRMAVRRSSYAVQFVSEHLKPELYRVAVEQRRDALGSIPIPQRTAEMCKLAVKNDGSALQYVPEDLKTKDICALALRQSSSRAKRFLPPVPELERRIALAVIYTYLFLAFLLIFYLI